MRLLRLTLLPSLLLTACAAPVYQPYAGGVGYSEVNIARNRYEIVYHGPGGMDEAEAKRLAIVRAAEIGREIGMSHFRVVRSRNDALSEYVRDPDLFPRTPWTGEQRVMTEWEWRRERELEASRLRHSVREVRAPVIRLTVDYVNGDCEACLSVEEKLKEARERGVIRE
jgi:hypothetical protein